MKRLLFVIIFLLMVVRVIPGNLGDNAPVVYDQGFIHPYGMVAYKNMILVSNYGYDVSDTLVPGKGYICAIQGGVVKPFIRADGHLTAPKGMAVYENSLFVADINKIVVYNLKKIVNPPVEISFPSNEIVLSDLLVIGSMLLVSVNDTGNIYGIDLREFSSVGKSGAVLLGRVPGAGNMAVHGTNLFVNSFLSEIRDSSLVYVGNLINSDDIEFKPLSGKLSPGQYLGISVMEETSTLLLSALKTDDIYRPVLYLCSIGSSAAPTAIDTGFDFLTPTSVLVQGKEVWILDHLQSKVFKYIMEL